MDFNLFLPEIIILVLVLLVLGGELILSPDRKRALGYLTIGGLLAALVADLRLWGLEHVLFDGMFTLDTMAVFMKAILLVATLLVILATINVDHSIERGEFYGLVLMSALGTMLMASSSDLITLFISLELAVLPCYVLAGTRRGDKRASEVALKYFLLGLLVSATLVYGMSLLYGLTSATGFDAIAAALSSGPIGAMHVVAVVMIIAGLGFKVAAVPFHFWAPDVFEGAPVPVASYLAVGPKAGGFAALLRLFPVALGAVAPSWTGVFAVLAVTSMFVGNLVALSQTHIRRMLGYSTIAHTGYLLIGLAIASSFAKYALIFYFTVYGAATLGAFLVIQATTQRGVGEAITDFAGLSRRSPYLAGAMAVFLFSLVGLPPLAGFMGKLYLFGSAVQKDVIWLAVIGVLNSVVSFGYYSGVIKQMYLVQPTDSEPLAIEAPVALSILALLLAVVAAGLYPTIFWGIIR